MERSVEICVLTFAVMSASDSPQAAARVAISRRARSPDSLFIAFPLFVLNRSARSGRSPDRLFAAFGPFRRDSMNPLHFHLGGLDEPGEGTGSNSRAGDARGARELGEKSGRRVRQAPTLEVGFHDGLGCSRQLSGGAGFSRRSRSRARSRLAGRVSVHPRRPSHGVSRKAL